jgi:hypothetical protein
LTTFSTDGISGVFFVGGRFFGSLDALLINIKLIISMEIALAFKPWAKNVHF